MLFYYAITTWYQENKRALPWRKNTDPYRIWLSEIMLQQTKIETVIPYYHRFLQQFPTLPDLANASQESLLKAWQGLGYYSRIRNMQQAAKIIEKDLQGVFPLDIPTLLNLPGIGSYTASAIASFANQAPVVCVDGNVMRVYARVFLYIKNILLLSAKKEIEHALLQELGTLSSDFNQGMMELGETICLPRSPQCSLCPCASFCRAFQEGKTDQLPLRIKQQTKKVIKKSVIILEYQETYALKKRDQSLLQHLYEPYVLSHPTSLNDLSALFGVSVHQIEDRGIFLHAFSHLVWDMQVYFIHLDQPHEMIGYQFVSKKEIQDKYPIATAYYKWLKPMLGI